MKPYLFAILMVWGMVGCGWCEKGSYTIYIPTTGANSTVFVSTAPIAYEEHWKCVEWQYINNNGKTYRTYEYPSYDIPFFCIREEGYRSDGIVVWRRPGK